MVRGLNLRLGGRGAAVPAATGHRYWRAYMFRDSNGPGSAIAAAEIEFYDSDDNGLTGSGTAAASNASNGAAANAFDGNTGTFWASNSDSDHWVSYDFGSDVSVAKLGITPRSGSDASQAPWSGLLQYSDDNSAWTTLFPYYSGAAGWTASTEKVFSDPATTSNAASRYIRLLFLEGFSGGLYSLAEVELRESAGGADVTSGTTATAATSFDGSTLPANAIDDDTGTIWASASNFTVDQWLKIDAGSGNTIDLAQVALTARTGSPNQYPEAFYVQISSDDSTYNTVAWFSDFSTGAPTALETRTYTL